MKPNLMSKVVASLLLGGLFGWYVHHDYVSWSLRGRDAFVAYQLRRFDLYMASPRPFAFNLIGMALLALVVCVVYESLVAGISAILGGNGSNPSKGDVR